MKRSLAIAAAAWLVATTAPAHAQEEASLVGCWTLQVGAWDPALDEARTPGFPPPRGFELEGRPGADEGRAVYQDGSDFWSHRRWRHWKWNRQRGGGVAIIFSTGFSGYRLRLEPRGDGLEGTIESFSDVTARSRAPATAQRASCPQGGR